MKEPCPPLNIVLLSHLVGQLDVGVAVTEASHVCYLTVGELQQPTALLILHLHDVEDALDSLGNTKQHRDESHLHSDYRAG